MQIETIKITFAPNTEVREDFIDSLLAGKPGNPVTVSSFAPPAIGKVWPGRGGIYLGIAAGEDGQPDAPLIMHLNYGEDLDWDDAMHWPLRQSADGHADFKAPTQSESALIYAHARHLVKADKWHWIRKQYSADYAFGQDFINGYQIYGTKKALGCVRAVRRSVL